MKTQLLETMQSKTCTTKTSMVLESFASLRVPRRRKEGDLRERTLASTATAQVIGPTSAEREEREDDQTLQKAGVSSAETEDTGREIAEAAKMEAEEAEAAEAVEAAEETDLTPTPALPKDTEEAEDTLAILEAPEDLLPEEAEVQGGIETETATLPREETLDPQLDTLALQDEEGPGRLEEAQPETTPEEGAQAPGTDLLQGESLQHDRRAHDPQRTRQKNIMIKTSINMDHLTGTEGQGPIGAQNLR